MKAGELFRSRKFQILTGLLLLLVIVNVTEWRRSSQISTRTQKQKSTVQNGEPDDPILLASKLREEKTEFQQEKRNIFTFLKGGLSTEEESQIAAAQPPPPPDPVCGNGICEEGEDLTNCEADCQPPPPPAPVITLRYIGYLSEPEGSVAFLTDGKEVFMGRVNDVVANQYRVLKITEDSVELGLLNQNNQSSTIRFQGNQGG